jgi:hypothetical protein
MAAKTSGDSTYGVSGIIFRGFRTHLRFEDSPVTFGAATHLGRGPECLPRFLPPAFTSDFLSSLYTDRRRRAPIRTAIRETVRSPNDAGGEVPRNQYRQPVPTPRLRRRCCRRGRDDAEG